MKRWVPFLTVLFAMTLRSDPVSCSLGSVEPLPDDLTMTKEDQAYMVRAYEISASAVEHGNHPFGALLVKDGIVLIEHENAVVTTPDVTEHAETGLVRAASRALPAETLKGSTLYTSTEPCIMCCGALYWMGVERLVYGVSSKHLSLLLRGEYNGFTSREIFARWNPELEVVGPINERYGLEQHAAFWPDFLASGGE
jgi:tRNA(Arg) A34 adenosine deaminase TadA